MLRHAGELNEHEKIVSVLREVDIVISTLAYPQALYQLKIIDAIKDVGNIKVPILCWKFGSFGKQRPTCYFQLIVNFY